MASIKDKINGDDIIAALHRDASTVLEGNHGVMFVRKDLNSQPRFIGEVKTPGGILMKARFFYRVQPWQEDHARRLVDMLNREIWHDGAWAVLWSHPDIEGVPHAINMAWQDADGDVCFVINSDRTLLDLQANGPESQIGSCEKAWREYMGFMDAVDVQADQKIKAGQGQLQKDPNDLPLLS